MRIGLLAPLLERVPPARYGGTERVIGWLADELAALGHDVDLYATGDSKTRASWAVSRPRRACTSRSTSRGGAASPS